MENVLKFSLIKGGDGKTWTLEQDRPGLSPSFATKKFCDVWHITSLGCRLFRCKIGPTIVHEAFCG